MNHKGRSKLTWRGVKGFTLGVLLVPSALLTAAAVGSADSSWFAWFGLLPLFLAIRLLSPAVAGLAGAFWGGCFYLFLAARVVPGLALTPHSFALLALALMLYAYLGGLLTRRVGFSPMLLALGWIAVELMLKPLGLRRPARWYPKCGRLSALDKLFVGLCVCRFARGRRQRLAGLADQ